jgi:hypothetical protein
VKVLTTFIMFDTEGGGYIREVKFIHLTHGFQFLVSVAFPCQSQESGGEAARGWEMWTRTDLRGWAPL